MRSPGKTTLFSRKSQFLFCVCVCDARADELCVCVGEDSVCVLLLSAFQTSDATAVPQLQQQKKRRSITIAKTTDCSLIASSEIRHGNNCSSTTMVTSRPKTPLQSIKNFDPLSIERTSAVSSPDISLDAYAIFGILGAVTPSKTKCSDDNLLANEKVHSNTDASHHALAGNIDDSRSEKNDDSNVLDVPNERCSSTQDGNETNQLLRRPNNDVNSNAGLSDNRDVAVTGLKNKCDDLGIDAWIIVLEEQKKVLEDQEEALGEEKKAVEKEMKEVIELLQEARVAQAKTDGPKYDIGQQFVKSFDTQDISDKSWHKNGRFICLSIRI